MLLKILIRRQCVHSCLCERWLCLLQKSPKTVFVAQTLQKGIEFVEGEYSKVNSLQNKWAVKVFREWKLVEKLKIPVLDPGGAFKDYCELHKVQPFSSTDLESMDTCLLNYWFSKFLPHVTNAEGQGVISFVLMYKS